MRRENVLPLTNDEPLHLGAAIRASLAIDGSRCAFRFGGETMSRSTLLEAGEAFAERLRSKGLLEGEAVIIDIEHNFALAVALVGVLMAGGTVVPLDPASPKTRRQSILESIEARFVVEQGTKFSPAIQQHQERATTPTDKDVAFVVFTSGSTGGPKGVEITHANYLERMAFILPQEPVEQTRLDLAWTPSSFIGMLDEFFYPLLARYPSVIAHPGLRSDPTAFAALCAAEGVSVFRITPSLLNSFLDHGIAHQLQRVQTIFCSGEELPAALQEKMHSLLQAELLNFYGATEAPGVAFQAFDRASAPTSRTICTPQVFAPMRVTAPDGQEVDQGERGEIWVGGCAVARGYRGRTTLTAEKFCRDSGERWYRTGDHGRLLEDGRIEVLGRADMDELNVNGVRINLPEACDVLRSCPGIVDGWISAVTTNGSTLLIAHYTSLNSTPVDPSSLRDQLLERLPPAAVPHFFLSEQSFPLLDNGKLNLQELASRAERWVEGEASGKNATQFDNHSTLTKSEQKLAGIWREILETPEFHPDANFFALGGNSLRGVRLIARVKEAFGIELPLRALLEFPTVRSLAARMRDLQADRGAVLLDPASEAPDKPALFCLHGLFLYRELAEAMRDEVMTYGVYIEDEAENEEASTPEDVLNLRRLAERYTEQILKARPSGPFHIAGLSRGGLVALEVGQILREKGHIVGTVALLDTNAPQSLLRGQLSTAKEALRKFVGRGNKKFGKRHVTKALYRQAFNWLSKKPYAGDVLLCKAAVSNFGTRRDDLGWGRFIGGQLHVIDTPGNHTSMLQTPFAEHLGNQIANQIVQY